MNDERVVRFDGIIQVRLNVFEAGRIESHNGDELCGSTGDVLGHAQAFVESVGGAENSHRNSIWVDGYLSKPRENVGTRENRAAIKAVKDLIKELFNDWGRRGYDDSVPGEVTKTPASGDRIT